MVKVFSVEVSDSLGGEIAVVRPQRLVYIESFPITLLSPTLPCQPFYSGYVYCAEREAINNK